MEGIESSMEGIQEFKNDLNRFTTIDSNIKQAKELMRPLKERINEYTVVKKQLEANICKYMNSNSILECKLSSESLGSIKYSNRTIKNTVSTGHIKATIADFFNRIDDEQFMKLTPKQKSDAMIGFIFETSRVFTKREGIYRRMPAP